MKNYKVTINGKTYDVGVEESGSEIKSVQAVPAASAQKAAPAPAAAPKAKPAEAANAATAGAGAVTTPLAGMVLSIAVSEGQHVAKGQLLMVFEAMKMENEIEAPAAGVVEKIHVEKGSVLETGAVVVTIG